MQMNELIEINLIRHYPPVHDFQAGIVLDAQVE